MKMRNPKVVYLSIIAIICIFLSVFVHWIFIIGAAIIIVVNQKELMKKSKKKKEKRPKKSRS